LVSTELAIRISIDDSVDPKNFRDIRGVNVVTEVNRSDDVAAIRRILDEWSGKW
jgi:hypothetical protein